MEMLQLAPSKVYTFDRTNVNRLNNMDDLRNYAINNGLIYIDPTPLSKIEIKFTILTNISPIPTDFIRVFFFKSLATYQSPVIHFNKSTLEYSTIEDPAWMNKPFIVESIGFAPEPQGFDRILQFKVSVYRK